MTKITQNQRSMHSILRTEYRNTQANADVFTSEARKRAQNVFGCNVHVKSSVSQWQRY